jgi:hypothetical protein
MKRSTNGQDDTIRIPKVVQFEKLAASSLNVLEGLPIEAAGTSTRTWLNAARWTVFSM